MQAQAPVPGRRPGRRRVQGLVPRKVLLGAYAGRLADYETQLVFVPGEARGNAQ